MLQEVLKSRRLLAVAAATVIAAGGVAVYVTSQGGGNAALSVLACEGTGERAESLDPLIGGDMAAFSVSGDHESLATLAFKTPDGDSTDIGAFAGKTVLLTIWATWCGPCRAEMPALDRLQAELGGEDFEVVTVNIDTGPQERALDFLDEIGVENLAFYSDSSIAIFNDLKRRSLALGLPVTHLIDDNGCRLGGMQGPAEWDSQDALALIRTAMAGSD